MAQSEKQLRGFRIAQVRRVIGLLRGKDLSQTQLAEIMPGSGWQSKISRWESGSEAKHDDLVVLSEMSGIPVDWILKGGDAVVRIPASPQTVKASGDGGAQSGAIAPLPPSSLPPFLAEDIAIVEGIQKDRAAGKKPISQAKPRLRRKRR